MTLKIEIYQVSNVTTVRVMLDGKLVGEVFMGPETKNIEFILNPMNQKK